MSSTRSTTANGFCRTVGSIQSTRDSSNHRLHPIHHVRCLHLPSRSALPNAIAGRVVLPLSASITIRTCSGFLRSPAGSQLPHVAYLSVPTLSVPRLPSVGSPLSSERALVYSGPSMTPSHVSCSALFRVLFRKGTLLPRLPRRCSPFQTLPYPPMLSICPEEHLLGPIGLACPSGHRIFPSRCVALRSSHTSSVFVDTTLCSCRSRSARAAHLGVSSCRPSSCACLSRA
jgi:hypothetical protein